MSNTKVGPTRPGEKTVRETVKVTVNPAPVAGEIAKKLDKIVKAMQKTPPTKKPKTLKYLGQIALLLVGAAGVGVIFAYMGSSGMWGGDGSTSLSNHPHDFADVNSSFQQISTSRIDASAYPLNIVLVNDHTEALTIGTPSDTYIGADTQNGVVTIGKGEKVNTLNLSTPNINLLENTLEGWCIKNKIKYTGILKVIAFRDEVIESFLAIGINPYYNGLNIDYTEYNILNIFKTNLSDGINEIIKIKKCIYEGYKFNLCVWNNKYKKYFLQHRNIPVFIKTNTISRMGDDSIQKNPNFIILSDIIFKKSFINSNMYEFTSTGCVSILDTYINVDLNFLSS